MPNQVNHAFRRLAPVALCLAGLAAAQPALAQDPAPSPNATVNLINLMVKRGLITRAEADGLIAQAETEAETARATAAAAAPVAAPGGTTVPVPAADGTVRVQYVPEMVRKQIRDEVRTEVMSQAKREGWATPNAIPDWTQRLKFSGDVRLRYEGDYFPSGNAPMIDFNGINSGDPYDVSNTNPDFEPRLNTTEDRSRFRLRARLGVAADLGDGFTAGVRIATGDSRSPVSTNQSLGTNGGFGKYALWLDRGYISYASDLGVTGLNVALDGGRFDNPFFSTDLVWDDDLGFDGLALRASYEVEKGLTPFGVLGAFPVYNTALNLSTTNDGSTVTSDDKWLYGAQAGVNWKINDDWKTRFGLAYYYFDNIIGKQSSPCTVLNADATCDTDLRRPSFAQKGNTYMALRRLNPILDGNGNLISQYEYFGLASGFHELALTARVDLMRFDPLRITLDGEYVKNLAFDKDEINRKALFNNLDDNGAFVGGDTAYMARLTVGTEALKKRWDWNLRMAFKHVESDSVVDGFTDSDFGLGGTNLEGYIVGGSVALSDYVIAGLRWQTADSIDGAPYSIDVFQIDMTARF